ncbi:SAF domain-containing protein [Williamsia sterculiae]|uniref:Flp pilus assembly protein CpaB n=1 Tax=Williamsia sterculiae TaxID=1344003 RepID=A0A1N7DL72_9NOCA|nr:SAF domain-containing protein [Williamsia sterculiae]SIR76629.1 Flp pilus assembly protein CpaB [Williamsia sterculiae]
MPADRRLVPTLTDRLRELARPGWARTLLVRRLIAGAFVVAALVSALAAHRADRTDTVLVAAHDLTPGAPLTAADVATRELPTGTAPDGALRRRADTETRTVTAAIRGGEVLTDVRLLSPRLPTALLRRPDARLVPVHIGDAGVPALLREGDLVDVLAAQHDSDDSAPPSVLVRGAVVAVVSTRAAASLRTSPDPGVVLLAMPETDAHRVAAANLTEAVTVVLH